MLRQSYRSSVDYDPDAIPLVLGAVVNPAPPRKTPVALPLTAQEQFLLLQGLSIPASLRTHEELAAWQQRKFDEVMLAREVRVSREKAHWAEFDRWVEARDGLDSADKTLGELNKIRTSVGLERIASAVSMRELQQTLDTLNARRCDLSPMAWPVAAGQLWGVASLRQLVAWLKVCHDVGEESYGFIPAMSRLAHGGTIRGKDAHTLVIDDLMETRALFGQHSRADLGLSNTSNDAIDANIRRAGLEPGVPVTQRDAQRAVPATRIATSAEDWRAADHKRPRSTGTSIDPPAVELNMWVQARCRAQDAARAAREDAERAAAHQRAIEGVHIGYTTRAYSK